MGILSVSNYSILPSIAGGLGVSFIIVLIYPFFEFSGFSFFRIRLITLATTASQFSLGCFHTAS